MAKFLKPVFTACVRSSADNGHSLWWNNYLLRPI